MTTSSLVAFDVIGQVETNEVAVEEVTIPLPLEGVGSIEGGVPVLPAVDYSEEELEEFSDAPELEVENADSSVIEPETADDEEVQNAFAEEMMGEEAAEEPVVAMDVPDAVEAQEEVAVSGEEDAPVAPVVEVTNAVSSDVLENDTFAQDYAVADRISPAYIDKSEAEKLAKIQAEYEKRIQEIEAEYNKALEEVGEVDLSVLANVNHDDLEDLPAVVDGADIKKVEKVESVSKPRSPDISPIADVKEVLSKIPAGGLSEHKDALTVKKKVAMDRSGVARGGVLPEIKIDEMDPNYRTDKGILILDVDKQMDEEAATLFNDLKIAHKALEENDAVTAIAYFKRAANIDAKYETRFGLATAYHMDGQSENAKKLYVELIAENNNDWRVLNNLLLLAGTSADVETLRELHKLEQFNSEFAAIPAHMGMIFTERGEFKKAAKKFLRAIELEPGNMRYRYNLALVLEKVGDVAGAVKIYQQLLFAARQGKELPVPYQDLHGRVEQLAASLVFNK